MNDFTKGELEDMRLCVDSFRISSIRGERRYGELCKKLQSMIDTYCEHKGHIGIHEWKTCNDCGRPFA